MEVHKVRLRETNFVISFSELQRNPTVKPVGFEAEIFRKAA